MITRIEIDGFKSFRNFAVNLRPFQVVVGGNGVGKSNLFDAIQFLSDCAEGKPLINHKEFVRGHFSDLLSRQPNHNTIQMMTFAVELLIAPEVMDDFGERRTATTNRLRYELTIEVIQNGIFQAAIIAHEKLMPLLAEQDQWVKKVIPSEFQSQYIHYSSLTEPFLLYEKSTKEIFEQDQGRPPFNMVINKEAEASILGLGSFRNRHPYPTKLATAYEMLTWALFHLQPLALREPCNLYAPTQLLPDGSNLPAVLYRMSQQDEHVLTDVSRSLSYLVPSIQEVLVKPLPEIEIIMVEIIDQNGNHFPSQVLSDGTLRFLAMATLRHDPQHHGLVCLEEPENGITPSKLADFIPTLKALATDFNDPDQIGLPFKQVLINTHSPHLMSLIDPEDLMFAFMPHAKVRATRMVPVIPDQLSTSADKNIQVYTLDQVRQYLESDSLELTREKLTGERAKAL